MDVGRDDVVVSGFWVEDEIDNEGCQIEYEYDDDDCGVQEEINVSYVVFLIIIFVVIVFGFERNLFYDLGYQVLKDRKLLWVVVIYLVCCKLV